MTIETFSATAIDAAWPPPLRALWRDAQGDWEGAHREVQDDDSGDGAWVHAYLHRKEGDASNARYWYVRARRPVAAASLDEEWRQIVTELLRQAAAQS